MLYIEKKTWEFSMPIVFITIMDTNNNNKYSSKVYNSVLLCTLYILLSNDAWKLLHYGVRSMDNDLII